MACLACVWIDGMPRSRCVQADLAVAGSETVTSHPRWACGLLSQVKHCALSLVGEPIMYPHINALLGMLHDRGISTFLVTNAQVCATRFTDKKSPKHK